MRHNTVVTYHRVSYWGCAILLAVGTAASLSAQRQPVPRPFPTPGTASPSPSSPGVGAASPVSATDPDVPTAASLGVPVYPNAQYITSYDAGRGQRFHLFGTSAGFADMVRYYSVVLRERGRRVYDAPPIHQFETARFRDREMDYRPSVTIKDYTWNGAAGYINTTPGGDPAAFPTIIQITTLPARPANR